MIQALQGPLSYSPCLGGVKPWLPWQQVTVTLFGPGYLLKWKILNNIGSVLESCEPSFRMDDFLIGVIQQ